MPLLRDGSPVGAVAVGRAYAGSFSERQIRLLQTFADQAVIAIENVRLFDEVQARTRDLTESLEQQTATSEVLKVISSSQGELEPVFQAMLANAVRICEAKFGHMFLYEGNEFRAVATRDLPHGWAKFLGHNTIPADPRVPRGACRDDKAGCSHRRCPTGPGVYAALSGFGCSGRAWRRPHATGRTHGQGKPTGRRHRHLSAGSPAVHR